MSYMHDLFIDIINMSITAGWIVLAVMILRFALKKAPKWIMVVLWGIVGIRLVFPVSLESIFSLIPSSETLPPDIAYAPVPEITSGFESINNVINPILQGGFSYEPSAEAVSPMAGLITAACTVWLC